MATTTEQHTSKTERFRTWNPFADVAIDTDDVLDSQQIVLRDAMLAVAYEISQLRAEIHFGRKGRA